MNKVLSGFALFIGACALTSGLRAETFPRFLFEAEALCPDRDSVSYANKGYAMSRPDLETGGWVTLQGTEVEKGSFVPRKEPLHLIVPAGKLPPGKYELSVRVVRWVGDKSLPLLNKLRIAAGNASYEHSFAATDGGLTPPGGVYIGDGRWQWIAVPTPVEVGSEPLTIDLSVEGGTGNYFGILVDAVELTPDEATKASSATPESKWSGDVAGTFLAETLPDIARISLLAGDPQSLNPVEAKMTIAPPSEETDRFLCGWIRNELQLTQANVRFSDGSAQSAEIPLGQMLHAAPVRLGYWYLLWLSSDDPRLKALDRTKPWEARLSATPLAEGVRLATSDWLWTSRDSLTRWSKEGKTFSLDVQQELAVASEFPELKADAVSPEAKLILWPAIWVSPDTHFLRDHIGSIKLPGVNGTTFSFCLQKSGRTISIGTEIFVPDLRSWNDFAPAAADLPHVDWSGLKDSLLRVDVTQGDLQLGNGIDWFDDAAWKNTLQNIGFCSRLVHLAKVRGIMLDTEEYSPCVIFEYPQQKLASTKSYSDYADEAFLRGKQFAEACQKECPGLTIMITHGTTELLPWVSSPPLSPTKTHGNLLPAFVDGLLSVDGPEIVDGHESSYTYHTPREFLEGDWQMDQAAGFSRNPALYRQKMGKGFGIWLDPYRKWNAQNENANYNSPETLENVLHWALRSSHHVWLYTESVNWFRDITIPNEHPPSAAYDKALKDCRAPHDPQWLPPISNLNP